MVGSEDGRAADLHRNALVIDTLGPLGPSTFTPAIEARLDELVAAGAPAWRLIAEIDGWLRRTLVTDELASFWEGWEEAGVDAVSLTVGAFGETPFTYENAISDLASMTALFDALPERFVKVTTAADLERAHSENKKGVILNFQNATPLGDDLSRLELFHALGIRIIQLTYNARNLLGDGCTERVQSGLSAFGVDVIREMERLGMMVDLSHCSEATTSDAMEVASRPVAITHSFCRSIQEHDRAKSDDIVRAIGQMGGYFGVLVVPFFITDAAEATLEHWLAHVDRAAELAGIEHVGIGTDWGEVLPKSVVQALNEEMLRFGFREEHRVDWAATVDGFRRWRDWPNLTAALLGRGYSEDEVRGILGGNFLRVFQEVVG